MEEHTTHKARYTNVIVTEKPGSEIEIIGDIPTDVAHEYRIKAMKKVQKTLELPGFRKGHVPDEIVLANVGESALMQETAEQAISEAYAGIVEEKKLDVVGRPAVTITKLAPGNPIGFKITTAVYPAIKLPNYKKLAETEVKKHEDPDSVSVTDEELGAELERLRGILAQAEAVGGEGDSEGDTEKAPQEQKLPDLDDAFAQKLGAFKDLADLKEKISTGLTMEKKQKAYEKRRLAIADAIIAQADVVVPTVFIEGEVSQMVASFEERVVRAGMTMEAYLAQVNKTLEELRKEWRPDAEKRAKLQLIFNEIAQKENLTPNAEKLEREVNHIKEHYPDAHEHSIRVYVAAQMTNDLVFRFLEGRLEEKEEEHDHHHGHTHA